MESYKTYIADDSEETGTEAAAALHGSGITSLGELLEQGHALPQQANGTNVALGRSHIRRQDGFETELPALLGPFAYDAIKSEGLEGIAEAIMLGAQLGEEDGNLLQRSSLPALGKLLELQQLVRTTFRGHGRLPTRRRFILYTPLAESIERSGPQIAVRECAARLVELARKAVEPQQDVSELHSDLLLIALDRWVGEFSQDVLLSSVSELLRTLRDSNGIEALSPFIISFFGPTTGELKQMLRGKDSVPSRLVPAEVPGMQRLLELLRGAGIESVEGGGDLAVLHTALTMGLDATVTHDLSRFRLSAPPSTTAREPSLLRSILESRARLFDECDRRPAGKGAAPAGRWRCWYPWLPAALDSNFRPDAPLGLEVVTAVALVRLMVPDLDYVGAPLSLCGPNATEVAHLFGANDIGFIAPDAESAAQLGVAANDPKSNALYRRILAAQGARDTLCDETAEEQGQ